MVVDSLLDTAAATSLQLALPLGMITWQARNLESTINLMFVSVALTPQIMACGVVEHLEQSSDHCRHLMKILVMSSAPIPAQGSQITLLLRQSVNTSMLL